MLKFWNFLLDKFLRFERTKKYIYIYIYRKKEKKGVESEVIGSRPNGCMNDLKSIF